MISDFLLLPLMVAVLSALLSGVLGCAVVWRRMAYLGDTIAHGALLGVAGALFLNISVPLGIAASAVAIAIVFVHVEQRGTLPADTTLGILSHGSLAVALVAISLSGKTVDIHALLFGDVLAATTQDAFILAGLLAAVWLGVVMGWNSLLRVLIHEDIAAVEGVHVVRVRTLLTLALALTLALSIQVTGILLITALLIVPAAAARLLAHTPLQMVAMACVLALVAVALGFFTSLHYDTPLAPTIVTSGLALLVVCAFWQKLRA